jgi:hypothetical protein
VSYSHPVDKCRAMHSKDRCNVRQSGFSSLFIYVLEVYRPVGSHYGNRVLTP